MDILNNIDWYINCEPKTATNKETKKKLTKKELETVIFDNSIKENVKLSFPLNNNYLFFVSREIKRPINVKQLLTIVYDFYQEPLNHEYLDEAFEEMEEWKDELIEDYGDIKHIKNFDVFDFPPPPDLCGLELNEETGEYIVQLGPI